MVSNTKRIALGSLFGVLILVFIGFVPAPSDDFLIGIQAFLLAISFLVVGRGGATYVGIVSGMLITLAKPQFFPLDLIFAVSYGVMVDGLSQGFRVKDGPSARKWRLVGVMTISTAVVGFVAYYVSAVMTNLVPNESVVGCHRPSFWSGQWRHWRVCGCPGLEQISQVQNIGASHSIRPSA